MFLSYVAENFFVVILRKGSFEGTFKSMMNLKLTLNFDRLFKVDHMVADPNP